MSSIVSLIQRATQSRQPRNPAAPVVNASVSQLTMPQPGRAQVHHEPRRRSQHAGGYSNGSYLSRARRSGFGARQPMFRVI